VAGQTTCKSGALTLDGGRSSGIRMSNSSIGRTTKFLMLKEERMKKEELLVYGATMEATIKSGLSSMLTKLARLKIKDLIKTSDSTETDHSTLDLECQ
jgi:hypothetical protein